MMSELALKYCPTTVLQTRLYTVVCPHDQLQCFVIFHHFTSTYTTMKNPYEAPKEFTIIFSFLQKKYTVLHTAVRVVQDNNIEVIRLLLNHTDVNLNAVDEVSNL